MFDRLRQAGFQVDFRSHAKAILSLDFPEVADELESVLLASTVPIEEIIGSGGGESKGTQRLRRALKERGWRKHKFVVKRTIDGIERESQSHEIDHVRTFDSGTIALEIEWNNKDPFFDRDLNNFRLLFELRAIDVGAIITRCTELQQIFNRLGRGPSFGNSTTHMAKLRPRLEGGSGGGCPIVVFGIRNACYIED